MLREEIVGIDGTTQPLRLRYYQVQGIYHLLRVNRMILGDGTGLGKCQVRETRVLSSDGLKELGSFAPSGFDPKGNKGRFYPVTKDIRVWTGSRMSRVIRFYWGGKKSTLRVTTRNGFQIEGTLVHPMKVRSPSGEGWVKLKDLREGDFLCVDRSDSPFPTKPPLIKFNRVLLEPNTKEFSYPEVLTVDLATLLGYIIAEGNRNSKGVSVTQHRVINPEPHVEIRHLFKTVFGWSGNDTAKNKDVRVFVSSQGIREYIIDCGVEEELARGKVVPWPIF